MTERPRVEAVVFDAYGTLFDVHAAMARHAGNVGEGWEAVSALWRQKQLEYSWVTSLTGPEHWRDFEALTRDALFTALNWHGGARLKLVDDLMAVTSRPTRQSTTRSSRWMTSRSYSGPSSRARSRVERPSSRGSSPVTAPHGNAPAWPTSTSTRTAVSPERSRASAVPTSSPSGPQAEIAVMG